MNSVYSYHTFILPFIWERCECNDKTLETFIKCFEKNPFWENVDMKDEHHMESSKRITSYYDSALLYKEYQYFHPFVRKAIYGFDKGVVLNYSFMPGKIRNKAHYYIDKNDDHFDLLINGINLKIFNTGVALFILECENHGTTRDGKPQNTIDAVKNINDYGRRISLPFFPGKPTDSICADKLSIVIDGIGEFPYDAKAFIEKLNTTQNIEDNVSLTYIGDFVKEILGFGSEYKFTSKAAKDSKSFYIYSALDDRMFVACYILDKNATNRFIARDNDGELLYTKDPKISSDLYELIFIDSAGNCTCPSREMRKDLLERHIYSRWIEYGTVYSIVNHGMICITNFEAAHLAESFLTMYIQMCCLALVQRASLLNFRREVSRISNKLEKKGKSLDTKTIAKLLDLQERFIAFQSQLHFKEVSSEEQAIEMYNMMYDFFFIEKELEIVKEQLDSLYDAANTTLDFSFNKWATIFALVSIILAVADVANTLIGGEPCIDRILRPSLGVGSVFCIAMSLLLLVKYRRRK